MSEDCKHSSCSSRQISWAVDPGCALKTSLIFHWQHSQPKLHSLPSHFLLCLCYLPPVIPLTVLEWASFRDRLFFWICGSHWWRNTHLWLTWHRFYFWFKLQLTDMRGKVVMASVSDSSWWSIPAGRGSVQQRQLWVRWVRWCLEGSEQGSMLLWELCITVSMTTLPSSFPAKTNPTLKQKWDQ